MKYLIALSLIQAAALAFFGMRVLAIDARTDDIAMMIEADASHAERPAPERSVTALHTAESDAARGPTAEELRQIIREEIAAFEDRASSPSVRHIARGETESRRGAEADAALAAENLYLKTALISELDTYIGRGKIDPAEMADLQLKIARLPDEDRREMLTRLTKAMNAGDLEGEF